jgi:membrane protease YdiL (CAAX protease family)
VIDEHGARAARTSAVPVWHPVLLVGLMLVVGTVGTLLSARQSALVGTRGAPVLHAYLPLLLVSWGLLVYVCRLGRRRSAFTELVGLDAYTPRRALGDVVLALVAAAAILGGEELWQFALGNARSPAADALLPRTSFERTVWCLVAVSAAISEEVVYRGYLTKELMRWTSSPLGGVIGQALLFALAHGEQGAGTMARFFVYALGLGALALSRRSLVPGILAHAGLDLFAGLSR